MAKSPVVVVAITSNQSSSHACNVNNTMSCKCAVAPTPEKSRCTSTDACHYNDCSSNQCAQQLQNAEDTLAAWEAQGCGEQSGAVAQVLEAICFGLEKETTSNYVRDCDYMKETQRHGLKNAWRVKICRWMFETGKAFDLSVDTIGCAISYMDQFLCVESVDKVMMQLLSLVCVFCASKMHDPEPLSLDELSLLCEARFSKHDMCRVEMHLLRVVRWELNPPNTFTFARDFVRALALPDTDDVVKSVTELLTFVAEEYASVRCKASSIALAAVQIVVGAQSAASKLAQLSVASDTTDEFLAAVSLVQRVHASVYASDNGELVCGESPQYGVSSSPVAVESHPALSVMTDIASLQQLLKIQVAAAPSATQRELFASLAVASPDSDAADQCASASSSRKRQRAASLSLAH